MSSISKRLLDKLFQDKEYQEYIYEYENKNSINLDKLESLLNNHIDLYRLFLKINIFLYRYDTKLLEDDLKDFSQLNETTLRMDDIDTIMNQRRDQLCIMYRMIRNSVVFMNVKSAASDSWMSA